MLFKHRLHSTGNMSAPDESKAGDGAITGESHIAGMSVDVDDIAKLAARLGLGKIVRLEPATAGVVNGVFFLDTLSTSEAGNVSGSYVLRLVSSKLFGKPVRYIPNVVMGCAITGNIVWFHSEMRIGRC